MGRKLTKEEFIRRASAMHNGKYDYSRVNYINGSIPVEIICPAHGVFTQQPRMHASGQGCPECAKGLRAKAAAERCARRHAEMVATGIQPVKKKRKKHVYVSPYAGMSAEKRAEIIAEKRRQTCLKKYGVPYAIASPEVRKKIKDTMVEHYGVENPMKNPDIVQKSRDTCMERYGVVNPMACSDIRQKAEKTMLKHYGVTSALKNAELLEKAKHTSMDRYGVENPMQNPNVVQKGKETCMVRYGVDNVWKSPEVQQKIRDVCEQRYGVLYAAQNADIYAKSLSTKRKLGHIGTSDLEQECGKLLVQKFGSDDVDPQHKDEKYPYMCDFYIKSLDLYVEINAFWSHGGHWYDVDSKSDQDVCRKWVEKAEHSLFYKNALENWTVRDVAKRQCACENDLNYMVVWHDCVSTVKQWISDGCPLRQDWR